MRSFDPDMRIGDAPMLAADGVEMILADVEESALDEGGYLHRTVLRQRVRSWEFFYAAVTAQELRYLDALLRRSSFTLRLRDPDGREAQCSACCTGWTVTHFDARLGLYKNLRFTVTEC